MEQPMKDLILDIPETVSNRIAEDDTDDVDLVTPFHEIAWAQTILGSLYVILLMLPYSMPG